MLANSTLILVPTELEMARIAALEGVNRTRSRLELCGFGAICAAARTATLLEILNPRKVVLVGVAGSYGPHGPALGTACSFERVAIEGIGAGHGEQFLEPARMGFAHWPGGHGTAANDPIHDSLRLQVPVSGPRAPLLLSVCAVSNTEDEARARRERFPEAVAEDMEAFGVALACRLAGIPLTVIRGISNRCGDRDKSRWCIDEALTAAGEVAADMLERV